MSRTAYELPDIIREFGKGFNQRYHPNTYQLRVLNQLYQCRTVNLGIHKDTCDCCHTERRSYNSCRNRHCPKCQGSKQVLWADKLQKSILKTKHFHMVFTIPHELNAVCLEDCKSFYGIMFKSVWECLQQFSYTHYGVESGAVCILHTWGENLSLHPHIHCLVPAVGQRPSGSMKYIGCKGKYLFPVRALSIVFRKKFLEKLEAELKKRRRYGKHGYILQATGKKEWVINCPPAYSKADGVIAYLGRYTHRVAISNSRLVNIENGKVYFYAKDYRQGAKRKVIPLDGEEFLRRFCQHILPARFVKIRRYGLYSSVQRRAGGKIEIETETPAEIIKRITGFDMTLCPYCGKGRMIPAGRQAAPRIRSPGTSLYDLIK